MEKHLQLPVLVTSLSTKVDGSIKIALETRELKSDTAASLFEMRNREAWAVIAPDFQKDISLPTERPDPAIGTKTPSQRLRAVLYRLWEQGKGGTDFESFYRVRMEQIIDQLKEKIQ